MPTDRLDPPPAGPDGVTLFEAPPSRRPYQPSDLLRLVVGMLLVAAGVLLARAAQSTIRGIESDLAGAFGRLPDAFGTFLLRTAQWVTSFIPTMALVVLLVRRRWKIALLLVLTSLLAVVAMNVADGLVIDQNLAALLQRLQADNSAGTGGYPDSTFVASATAVVTVAAPWLSRRWKQALWYLIGALVVLRLLAAGEPAFDLVLALGIGTVVGAGVLLVFGSPRTEPGPVELLEALRRDGFDPAAIERLGPGHGDGALRYWMTERDGTARALSLRTPDEQDADLLQRLYRGLRFQASEVGRAYGTIKRRIEHEALALSVAAGADVRAPRLVRIGTTGGGSAYLVTDQPPTRPLDAADLAGDGVLVDLWGQLDRLHRAGVAHRRLGLESIRLDADQQVWMTGFDGAQTAPSEREMARDVAELLTETALVVGAEEAVDTAVAAIGATRVAPALRMLQPLALPPALRARAKAADGLLEHLRTEVNAATGEPGLELEELERIKPRTVLIVAASALAFYSLLPQLTNLSDTIDAFGTAQPLWIVAAVAASAITYLFAAVCFQGAVADPLPFAANVRAQVATSFAGLVGPGGAGGFAVGARFLERAGVRPAEAGASVAVNAIAGFVVHVTLLAGFIWWAGSSGAGTGSFSLPDSTTVLWVVAGALAVIGVIVAVRPLRHRVVRPALSAARVGLGQIGRVFTSPARVVALFGGSAALSLTYVIAVALSVQAFGGGLSFAQIGAAYLAAVALATLAPTPGGLGALESAMIAGFTGFGLSGGVAVSATLTFRLATFWLPILPGWASLGWMQRNGEL